MSVWVNVINFHLFEICIFLFEVKHKYIVENVYFSDDIKLGLSIILFKKSLHWSVPIKGQVGLQCFVYVYKKSSKS